MDYRFDLIFLFLMTMIAKEVGEYKRKVQASLKQKMKEQPRKHVRGKDRLMKAATKSTHIYFGSDDESETGEDNLKQPVSMEAEQTKSS